MKKALFIMALCMTWSLAYAQDYSVRRERRNNEITQEDSLPIKQKAKLTINMSIGASINYTHLFNKLKGDSFVDKMGQDLVGVDANLFLLYLGFDCIKQNTGYIVYGFKEQVTTYVYRIGPSFWYGTERRHWGFAPFVEFCNVKVNDTSKNSIGARTYYDNHAQKTGFGVKLSYTNTLVEMGLRISSLGIGLSIGIALPMYSWF